MAYDCSDGYLALRDAWSAEHSGGKRQVLCRGHFVTSYGHAADQQRLARGSQAYQPRARSLIECLEQMAGQGSPSCVKLHVFSNPTATLCRILNVRKHGRSNLQSHMHCYMSLFRHATENPFATTSTNIGNLLHKSRFFAACQAQRDRLLAVTTPTTHCPINCSLPTVSSQAVLPCALRARPPPLSPLRSRLPPTLRQVRCALRDSSALRTESPPTRSYRCLVHR